MPGVEVQTVANALDIHPFMLSRWRMRSYAARLSSRPPHPALSPPKGCLGLVQPETHVHLAVHLRRSSEVLLGLCSIARAAVQLAEAEAAVSDEGTHVAVGSQRHGGAEVRLGGGDVESFRM